MTKLERISSTKVGTYQDCQRKAYFVEEAGGIQDNAQMDFGTLWHAVAEHAYKHGCAPSVAQVREMDGNYDPPSMAMDRNPDLWPDVLLTYDYMAKEHPDYLFGPPGLEIEVCVDDWGLMVGDVLAGSYIDRLDVANRRVEDWKTRGDFRPAPRTQADFLADKQLSYYGAVCHQKYGGSWTMCHLNILRPGSGGPRFIPIEAELPAWWLRDVWRHMCEEVVPHMIVDYAKSDSKEVDRDSTACYKYGRCEFMDKCHSYNSLEDYNVKEPDLKVNSPQAPPNLEPVPYDRKLITLLSLNITQLEACANEGIRTMADVDKWLALGNEWSDLKGFGPKTADKVARIHEAIKDMAGL